jgi:hypothetical protein
MTTPDPPPQRSRTPDLPEVFIVLLISAAVVIFVFWISTQFLGAATFQNLPPWLTAVFKNVWAAVGAGATGIGLALLKAFTSRGQPQPNYFKYISFSVSGFLLIILVLVRIGSPKPVGPYPPPPNTSAIDYNKSAPVEFDLENPSNIPLKYRLQGSFTVQNGILTGRLASGKVEAPHVLPEMFPRTITRISFRACYNDPTIPELVRNVFPPTPKARDSLDVNLQLKPDASYALQSGEFTFELPPRNHVSAAWLCAALATDVSYFPAE